MNQKDRAVVEAMEAKYDSLSPKLDKLRDALEDFQKHYADYVTLRDFYGSTEWFRLFEEPHAAIKCGVLSEDQLYNVVLEHNELLVALLDLSAQMSRNM